MPLRRQEAVRVIHPAGSQELVLLLPSMPGDSPHCSPRCISPGTPTVTLRGPLQAARLYNEDRKEYNRRVKAVVEASWADDGGDEEGEDDEDEEA